MRVSILIQSTVGSYLRCYDDAVLARDDLRTAWTKVSKERRQQTAHTRKNGSVRTEWYYPRLDMSIVQTIG